MSNLINISIDDISPHPMSSLNVLNNFREVIEIFPEIKISLFVPVAYWRTMRREVATTIPLEIDKFPEFCNALKSLGSKNFELCYHGYYHGIPGKSDNDEMKNLSYEQMLSLINAMREKVSAAGLSDHFKEIIRPPAWRMSPDAIRAAKDSDVQILALSSQKYTDGSLDYGGEDKKFGKVVYYTSAPPGEELKLVEKTEIVYHACEWDKNYFSKSMAKDLIDFLVKHQGDYEFSFMKGML